MFYLRCVFEIYPSPKASTVSVGAIVGPFATTFERESWCRGFHKVIPDGIPSVTTGNLESRGLSSDVDLSHVGRSGKRELFSPESPERVYEGMVDAYLKRIRASTFKVRESMFVTPRIA